MPNHCGNYVQIQGPEEAMKILIDKYEAVKKEREEGQEDPCILKVMLPIPILVDIDAVKGGMDAFAVYKETGDTTEASKVIKGHGDQPHWLLGEHDVSTIKELFDLAIEEMQDKNVAEYAAQLLVPVIKTASFNRPRIAAWGSKWGYYDINLVECSTSELSFSAQSAWGPPIVGLKRLSKNLGLEILTIFDEPGMNFAGQITIVNGDETESIEYENYWRRPQGEETPLCEEMFKKIAPYQRLCIHEDTGEYICMELLEGGCYEEVELDELSYREYLLLCDKGKLPPKSIIVDDGFFYRNWDFDFKPYTVQIDKETKRITSVRIEGLVIDVSWDGEREQEYIVLDGDMLYIE